ncbi:hypothetical protein RRG08_056289 [Elysia crispata]|uniref:Uncharacterized protein n=1 Tax=Elysia crispata TaxID=231223 RepID=A0AAE1AWY9_9GAST|nr:hypothetical protein RRG08_056289 [Elysia crispata]
MEQEASKRRLVVSYQTIFERVNLEGGAQFVPSHYLLVGLNHWWYLLTSHYRNSVLGDPEEAKCFGTNRRAGFKGEFLQKQPCERPLLPKGS